VKGTKIIIETGMYQSGTINM